MIKNKRFYVIVALLAAAVFYSGCIPEDTLEWSDDGSIGLLRIDEALYLVDGQTGQLTEVSKEGVQPWPDISADGKLIAYAQSIKFDNLDEALQMLPNAQIKLIEYTAEIIKQAVIDANGLINNEFPLPEENILSNKKEWPVRYLCENADSDLLQILGDEALQQGSQMPLECFQLIITPADSLDDKTIVTTNIFYISRTDLSPDMKNVAYIMPNPELQDEEGYMLLAASLHEDIPAMLVSSTTAIGYDWRPDSRAISYMSWDGGGGTDFVIGTLAERIVADDNNKLLAEAVKTERESYTRTHNCTGSTKDLAGVIYYPWLSVKYGPDDRLFFTTVEWSLPSSKMDEGRWSLYCYDPVTTSVVDVLPPDVAAYTNQNFSISAFELSPDSKKVLLPIKNNRFIGYELGTGSMALPIEEDEGFGEEDVIELAPAFKGNIAISFMISGESHFLPKIKEATQDDPNLPDQQQQESPRREIIIVNDDGSHWILSETWPDEL
ncbi:MAG: hypothetical protein ACYTE8_07745 [Planctomycetota bacterium]|jgi:hypothetical protein